MKKLLFVLIMLTPMIVLGQSNAHAIERTGDALQLLIPAIGLSSTIFLEQNQNGIKQFCKSLASNLIITQTLKLITKKRRPNGSCCTSFPSGHTSIAFMGAGFIHRRYSWKYSIPAYIGATFVGYSRVETNKHYVEDVIAGAAIGILSSLYFTTPYKGVVISLNSNSGTYSMHIRRQI